MGITSYPDTPRLVNRFSLGADPEFTFADLSTGAYLHAEALGLTTMQAFGCDMAGRQAEIRAYPSRFALEVVASIVDSLRWMYWAHGADIAKYNWTALAHNGLDGCGGHIHYGRKRKNRHKDIKLLDGLTQLLLQEKAFNSIDFNKRCSLTKYGRFGDIRLQAHGYEYRTFPTQLQNPWLTYFVLVISKLLLYQGGLENSPCTGTQQLVSLLKKYKDLDDDAAIAWSVVSRCGIPIDRGGRLDFKPFWGVGGSVKRERISLFFPSTIKPERETCLELFNYFTQGKALPRRTPSPTWEPFSLPKGFFTIEVQKHTLGHLPDIGMNLICKHVPVSVKLGNEFVISSHISLPIAVIREALRPMSFDFLQNRLYKSINITVPQGVRDSLEKCKLLNKVLSNTDLFPVCKAKDWNNVNWQKWDELILSPTTKPLLGRLLANVKGKVVKKEDPF